MNIHNIIKGSSGNEQWVLGTIKIFTFGFLLIAYATIQTACNNHKEGDGHNYGKSTAADSSIVKASTEVAAEKHREHEEGLPTIASLTKEQMETVGIEFSDLENKALTATIKANGNLKVPNGNKANVTSLYGGVIQSMQVQVGSRVGKGQIVAIVKNAEMLQLQEEYLTLKAQGGNVQNISTSGNAQYASLQLEKQSMQPQIDYAQKELARQKELFEGNAGARKNIELAQSNLQSLQKKLEVLNNQLEIFSKTTNTSNNARLSNLKIQLQTMGINVNNISANKLQTSFTITSPISGTVSNVFSKIGSYVDVSSPIAEIVDNGSLHLDLNVFEKDLPLLKVGQTIHFTLTNNPTKEYDAVVYSIGNAFENESKTIPVHCNVNGNKQGLIDGMNITGIVSLNDVTTPAVPNEAFVAADGKYYVFIVTTKEAEEHHEEGEEGHNHEEAKNGKEKEPKNTINFEKIEVAKGVSNLGYTAVTFVNDIPANAKVVTKGAFFINAKLTNTEGHSH